MCGRFVSTTDPAVLGKRIGAVDETGHRVGGPNYNVAPTSTIAAVVACRDQPDDTRVGETCTRRILPVRWGLVPPWVKADSGGRPLVKSQLINARAETLISSPAFRSAGRSQRCLVPMDGYYEWMPNPEPGAKTPYYMCRRDGSPILVAGLWSAWRPDGAAAPLLTATIVTTDAVGELAGIHDRMPLLLDEHEWDRWLDPDRPAPKELLSGPPDIGGIAMRQVSTLVNNVRNNGPELVEPVGSSNQPIGLF
ncbi:MAG: SOS response-associated peptidase [Mycobacterium sp.]